MDTLGDVVLEDSYVLDLGSDAHHVWLTVECALGRTHPRFYWPPRPNEQHAYALARVELSGVVAWIDGPHPPRSPDASGARDFGDPCGWTETGRTHRLEGEWGLVTVADVVTKVSWSERG